MAKANQVNLCPECEAELPTPIPTSCPACRHVLYKAPKNPSFETPDYLHYQKHDRLQEILDETEHQKTEETTVSKEQIQNKRNAEVEAQLVLWAETAPSQDRNAAANDTMLFLKHVLHAKTVNADDLMKFVSLCVSIGDLAKTIQLYLKAGGRHNVGREIDTTTTNDGELDSEETAPA